MDYSVSFVVTCDWFECIFFRQQIQVIQRAEEWFCSRKKRISRRKLALRSADVRQTCDDPDERVKIEIRGRHKFDFAERKSCHD